MTMADARRGCLKNLGRILAIILVTSALLLVGGTIYVSTVILPDTNTAFERRLWLPNQHILTISKRPACTWGMPSIIACYHGGVRPHPELSLIYRPPPRAKCWCRSRCPVVEGQPSPSGCGSTHGSAVKILG